MQIAVVAVVLLAVAVGMGVGVGVVGDSPLYTQSLEETFNDRATVESIIDCFLEKITCSPQQQKIKERAYAAMRNLGTCPRSLCTPKQQQEITRSMELLQQKHPDLFLQLIASIFGIDIS
ncbi:hypothetical protein OTU49_013082 [Cherax quadricarinatus]|uniref:Uncharacterized protein n=1 Tax=Cherax quadricarinatus TaxID=27406 RepID=A0AAW0VTZ0_CHEQU|nr:uncharacterized protein LOC128704583 [Cherax quadricarinatus]